MYLDVVGCIWMSLVHFCIQVALNIAPLMHTDPTLNLETRCELALTGFLALDVMKLLSEDVCARMQLPKGSCFMAAQSTTNLQVGL